MENKKDTHRQDEGYVYNINRSRGNKSLKEIFKSSNCHGKDDRIYWKNVR